MLFNRKKEKEADLGKVVGSDTPSKKTTKEKKKRKRIGDGGDTEQVEKKIIHTEDETKSIFAQRSIIDLIAPTGLNPNPLDYLVVNDNGANIYIRNFYIDKMSRRTTFANTFAKILSFPNSRVSVFIEPLLDGKAIKELDKQIISLDSEAATADEDGDRNRLRKVGDKMSEAESWARMIDSGENSMFEVGFLITLFADSLDNLDIKCGDLKSVASEKSIEISATYACHPEAFQMNTPINKGKKKMIKYHPMDKFSLSTIFNHTRSEFYHKNGVTLGRNYYTGKPIAFDIYDSSHNGFGVIIAGGTGSGKSTTVKILTSRYEAYGYRFVSLDTQARGNRGEYAVLAESLNGVNYEINPKSKNIINLFELDVQKEYDEITGLEYNVLDLATKITDVKYILSTMIRKGRSFDDFAMTTILERIITDSISELYAAKNIVDGDINSLYENGTTFVNGKLTSGKVKKALPTVTEFYILVLNKRRLNNNRNYDLAYDVILAGIKDYVRNVVICNDCGTVYTLEEYQRIKDSNCTCPKCHIEGAVEHVKGIQPYYDGQSTISIDEYTPFTNIDISQLHDKDKPVAQQIALNYIQENFIKKNSMDVKKANKMVVILDETHKMFPYEDARKFIVDVYRTARKYNVSPWTATQRLADYALYEECKAIITNTSAKFILRHDVSDNRELAELANLTESQIERVNSLDKGQTCIIDTGKVVFCIIDMLEIEKMIAETDAENIKKMYESA